MRLFIIGSVNAHNNGVPDFEAFCNLLGQNLAKTPSTLILCSPYPDSCDSSVVNGIKQSTTVHGNLQLELHYPGTVENEDEWGKVLAGLDIGIKVMRFRHESIAENEQGAMTYAWLFSQLQAIANANFVLVIGGKLSGTANLLIQLAEAQQKQIVPLPNFGGIGEVFFNRIRYKLIDFWGSENLSIIQNSHDVELLVAMLNNHQPYAVAAQGGQSQAPHSFFISYAKARPAEADFVEMILRRRNLDVLRDDNDFGPGENIPRAINEMIHKSTIFIALWCSEYACSPWCFDELNLALSTHTQAGHALWIFQLDKTRIIHPKARNLLFYPIISREELEGKLLSLIQPWEKH